MTRRLFIWLTFWSRPNRCGKSTGFPITLFVTFQYPVSLRVQQGRKCGVQSSEDIDLTVGDLIVHLFARIGDFPRATVHFFALSSAMPWAVLIWDITKCKLYVAGVIYLTSSGWVLMYFSKQLFWIKYKLYVAGVGYWSDCVDNIVDHLSRSCDFPWINFVAVL